MPTIFAGFWFFSLLLTVATIAYAVYVAFLMKRITEALEKMAKK